MNAPRTSSLERIVASYTSLLRAYYKPGFGIMTSLDPSENFYNQIWTRDFAHAAVTYFHEALPHAVEDSLKTLLSHQRRSGELPIRVEREYMLLKVVPGLRFLARPAFSLFQEALRGRSERPVFRGQDFNDALDTIPAFLVAAGSYFSSSKRGASFISARMNTLARACEYFYSMADQNSGLVRVAQGNMDWADSIVRGGELGVLNVLWVRGLELMTMMFAATGRIEEQRQCQTLFARAHASLMQRIYCRGDAYFRSRRGEDRLDTVASVLGSLFFLDATECARVQDTLRARVKVPSGFSNFDPPYPAEDVLWPHKLIGHAGYHNAYAWPWTTCLNIQVKTKIAREHPGAAVRERFRKEAIEDLFDTADLFETAGGAYEIFLPEARTPAITHWYHPPRNFLPNLAGFVGAYRALESLGLLS